MAVGERFKNAWNAFLGRDPTYRQTGYYGSYYRPDRYRLSRGNDRSLVTSIYNQIAVDCSSIDIKHVRLDDEGNYKETMNSSLNRALTLEANIDQTGRDLIRDSVLTLLEQGCVAIVPVDTTKDPDKTDSYEIITLRAGKVIEWFPNEVLVELYNQLNGQKQQILLQKGYVAIVENPFYAIMNEPNSTAQRLIRVLNQLDRTNEENSAGKLDLIVQLPYPIRSPAKRKFAEDRRKDIEAQLTGSQYGIAYTDVSEKVIQLNRGIENNLWVQAKELKEDLYSELGFSPAIFNGTADEKTFLNYYNRTIEPIMSSIAENMERKWLSLTAQSQKQAIRYFRDPFKLIPVEQVAEIGDKFTRNEIMTSNEVRSKVGLKPSDDPKADELRNANLNHPDEGKIKRNENDDVGNE